MENRDKSSLRNVLGAFVCFSAIFLSLEFLRLFNILGSECDLLIRWISPIGVFLFGMAIGIGISEKKIRVRGVVASLLLFAVGFITAPLLSVGMLMLLEPLPFSRGNEGVIFGGSIVLYLLLYMGFFVWLRRRGIIETVGFE